MGEDELQGGEAPAAESKAGQASARPRGWSKRLATIAEFSLKVTIAILVLTCLAAAAYNIRLHGWGSDAAAWTQAGGSIAAISGAAWLAGAEARRQRKMRRREREEVAWGVRFALGQAKFECNAIAWEIVGPEATPTADDRRHWRLRAEVSRRLLKHYAERTDHIHPAVMHVANNAVALLDQLDSDLDQVHDRLAAGEAIPSGLASDVTCYIGYFDGLVTMLDERMRGVILALDESGDGMPEEGYEPWLVPKGMKIEVN